MTAPATAELRLEEVARISAEYERGTAPARVEYQRVKASALAEYGRVTAAAWAEYQRVAARTFAKLYNGELRSRTGGTLTAGPL